MGKIQIFKTQTFFGKRFYFRVKAENGETIAVSEAYNSKQACMDGITSLKMNVNMETEIVDLAK